MKIVFCKHLIGNKEYVFKVNGYDSNLIKCNTIMVVDTSIGKSFVIATSDIEECSEFIALKLTNGNRLKDVKGILADSDDEMSMSYVLREEFKRHQCGLPF